VLALSPAVTVQSLPPPPLGFPTCISFCINIAYFFLCVVYCMTNMVETIFLHFFIFKFVAYSLCLYIEGNFLSLYLSLYVAIFKFPTYTVLSHFCPSYFDIVYTALFSTLVSYPNKKLRDISSLIFSILYCICISLFLVLIIWHVWGSSFILPLFLTTLIYLKSILYSSSLRFIAYPPHFRFPFCR